MAGITPLSEQTAVSASELNRNRNIKERTDYNASSTSLSALRVWFKTYATDAGGNIPATNNNIGFSDFKSAYVPGSRVKVMNEDYDVYSRDNNAVIAISPWPGADTPPASGGYVSGYSYRLSAAAVAGSGPADAIDHTASFPNTDGLVEGGETAAIATSALFSSTSVSGAAGQEIKWGVTTTGAAGNGIALTGTGATVASVSANLEMSDTSAAIPGDGSNYYVPIKIEFQDLPDLVNGAAVNGLTYNFTGTNILSADIALMEDAAVAANYYTDGTADINIADTHLAATSGYATSAYAVSGQSFIFADGTDSDTVDTLVSDHNGSAGATEQIAVLSGGSLKPFNGQVMTAGGGVDVGAVLENYVFFGPRAGPNANSSYTGHQISGESPCSLSGTILTTGNTYNNDPQVITVTPGFGVATDAYVNNGTGNVSLSWTPATSTARSDNFTIPCIVMSNPVHPSGDSVGTLSGASIHTS